MTGNDFVTARYKRKARFRQYLSAFLANLSSFSVGTMLGWTSPLQPLLSSPRPPVGDVPLSAEFISWVGSVNYLGSILGTSFWGVLSDRLGRRSTGLVVALPFLLGWGLTLAARDRWWLLLARFIIGVGCSGVTINTPIYIAELADPQIRGSLGSFLVVFISAGCLFANVIGTIFSYHGVAVVCMSIPLIFLITFPFLPESPVYLWTHGKKPEAERALLWFRGGDTLSTIKEIEALEQRSEKSFQTPSYRDLIDTKGVRKALIISVGFIIGQQFCGFLAILTFSVKIFQDSDSSISAHHCLIVVGTLQFISSSLSSMLVDRFGRRILLMASYLAMFLSLTTLGVYLYYKNDSCSSCSSFIRLLPIMCLSIFVIFFAVGVGPVPFIVMSEIFPPNVRGFAMAKVQMLATTLSFVTVKTFPFLNSSLGSHGCFLLYSTFCAALCVFTYAYVPETKGKPLQVILKELNGEVVPTSDDSEGTELNVIRKAIIVK